MAPQGADPSARMLMRFFKQQRSKFRLVRLVLPLPRGLLPGLRFLS